MILTELLAKHGRHYQVFLAYLCIPRSTSRSPCTHIIKPVGLVSAWRSYSLVHCGTHGLRAETTAILIVLEQGYSLMPWFD